MEHQIEVWQAECRRRFPGCVMCATYYGRWVRLQAWRDGRLVRATVL